jgi:hypothetical protein
LLFAHILLNILIDIKWWDFYHIISCDRLCFRSLAACKLNLIAFVIQFLSQSILHFGGSVKGVDFIWGHNFTLSLRSVRNGLLYPSRFFRACISIRRILDCANLDVINVFNFDLAVSIIFRIHVIHSISDIRSLLNKLAISAWLDPTSIQLLAILADLASGVLSHLGSFLASRTLSRTLSERLSWALRFLNLGWFVGVVRLSWFHRPLQADVVDAGESCARRWNLTVLILANTSRWPWGATRT